MELKTNYKDAVFIDKKKYNMITNSDGTISLEDVTEYSEEGDDFGAADVNAITNKINENVENEWEEVEIPDDELNKWEMEK